MQPLEEKLFSQVLNVYSNLAQIRSLNDDIQTVHEEIKENLTLEMAQDLEVLKSAIITTFPTASIKPTTLGFSVKCPEFKNYSKTDISKKINLIAEKDICKAEPDESQRYKTEVYFRYKVLNIVLTKGYMRKAKPQLKVVFDTIEC